MCQAKFEFDAIKSALETVVADSKAMGAQKAMKLLLLPDHDCFRDGKEETEHERKKRIGMPTYDIEQLLKECNCEEQIPKLQEHGIDGEVFWYLEDGDLTEVLELKSFGKRKKLLKRKAEIMEEHEKAMAKKREKEKEINKDEVKKLIRKATVIES